MPEESLKYKTKKGLYWQSINQALSLGVQFVVGVILARLLTPEDFGITALPGVFLAIANLLVDCGFGTALVRKPDLSEEDKSTAFYYGIIVGTFLYLLLFLSSGLIANFYDAPVLKPVLRVTAIGLLLGPIGSVQGVTITRNLDFKTNTKISLVCVIVSGFLGLLMAFTGYGIWALVIPPIASSIVRIVLLYFVVPWLPKGGWSKNSFQYLWGFGSKLLLSYMIGTIYENLYPLIIGKAFSVGQLGAWNQAQRYANLPSKQATNVLQSVTFPVLSKMQNDDEALANNYRRIIKLSAFVVFPMMLILAALARPIIILLITDKWADSIYFLQIICFGLMLYPVHAINLNLLQVKGKSDFFLKLEVIKKILGLVVLIATIPMGLVAMAYGTVAVSWLSLVINTYYTGKILNLGIVTQLRDLFPSLFLSLVSFFVVLVVTHFVSNMVLQIIIGGLLAVTVYLSIAIVFKWEEIPDLEYLLTLKGK